MNPVMRTLLFTLMAVIISCENEPSAGQITVDIEMNNSQIFEYRTGISGDEEGARITQQALNYEISEMVRNASTQWEAVYRYKPKANFVGSEEVIIRLEQGSDGASPSNNFTNITITIFVTE